MHLKNTPPSTMQIADRLAALAQLLSARKKNSYKVRAYQRAAAKIRTLSESVDELVRSDADLTEYAGIGDAISSVLREIVMSGALRKLDELRAQGTPEIAGISEHPRLDPKRVLRIYKKLKVASVSSLRENLESGEIEKAFGTRMAQHVRQGLTDSDEMLLYRADELRGSIEDFLLQRCGVGRAEVVGDYRGRVEIVDELSFIVRVLLHLRPG
jgi:DNA polymerase (family X)